MNKVKICIIVIIILFSYVIGNILPIQCLVPNIVWNRQISSGELVYYFITFIQAVGTIAAVIIALFSDNIKAYFRRPNLEIKLHKDEILEELNNNKINLKAKRYHNSIDVFNSGNLNADNCEISVDSILFKGLGSNSSIELISMEYELRWSGNDDKKVTYIPIQGKKNFQIYEILPPEEQGTPNENDIVKVPPRLIIGKFEVPEEYCGGEWCVSINIYSPCMKPIKCKLTIKWDGSWEYRQMEMKEKVTNKIEISKD